MGWHKVPEVIAEPFACSKSADGEADSPPRKQARHISQKKQRQLAKRAAKIMM